MATFTPWPFQVGKERRYTLDSRLDGPQSRFGRFHGRENLLTLTGFEPRMFSL